MTKKWFLIVPITILTIFCLAGTIYAAQNNCWPVWNPPGYIALNCTYNGTPPCPCNGSVYPWCGAPASYSGIHTQILDGATITPGGWNGSGYTSATVEWSYPSGAIVDGAQRVDLYDGCSGYHTSGYLLTSARSSFFNNLPSNCLAPGQRIEFRIRNGVQYGTGGGGTDCHVDKGFTYDIPNNCAAPNPNISASCNSSYNNNLICTWNNVGGATQYQGQIDNNWDFSSPIVNSWGPSTTRESFNQPDNVTYRCRVRVTDSNGSCVPPSAWSSTASVTKPCPTPPPTLPPCAAPNTPTLKAVCNADYNNNLACTWDNVSGATEYRGQIDNNWDFSSPILNTLTILPEIKTWNKPDNVTYHCQARVTKSDGSCEVTSNWSPRASVIRACPTPVPSCTIEIGLDTSMDENTVKSFQYFVYPSPPSEPISKVCFNAPLPLSITLPTSPDGCTTSVPPDNPGDYAVSAGDVSVNTTEVVTGTATLQSGATCSDTKEITINFSPDPWWQVINADVWMKSGSLESKLPLITDKFENPKDHWGFDVVAGIPVYSSTHDFGSGSVSNETWIANTSYLGSEYNYSYFYSKTPSEITPYPMPDNDLGSAISNANVVNGHEDSLEYKWIEANNLILDSIAHLGNNKIVLFVDGVLNINDDIELNKGNGFFMVIVSGDIIVGSNVDILEGIYVTDHTFSTGTGINDLFVRGTVIAWDNSSSVILERDLADNSQPGETFQFAPDQLLRIPPTFGKRQTSSKEVAP